MSSAEKIKTIEELTTALVELRAAGRKIVHCHGVFDLLHIGHIRYLQKARALGDVLVVTVTADRFVNKGPHRPAFADNLRADALAALDCVDFVAVNQHATAVEIIPLLRANIYAKGGEYRQQQTPELLAERAAAQQAGTTLEYIDEFTSSSSQLLNTHLSPFSEEVEAYLHHFRQQYSAEKIMETLSLARRLKVLVVGEAIVDEYYACRAIGRSTKAPILAAQYESHQKYAGGALAVANHLAAFCGEVSLVTMLGKNDSQEEWIRAQLAENISPTFFYKPDAPTIVKRRYRESYYDIPLFAMNVLDDTPLDSSASASLQSMIEDRLKHCDTVIAADYGHAMLGPSAVEMLCDLAPWLAVNTQSNAANAGYHTADRYRRADYLLFAEQELRLQCRDRSGELSDMLRNTARQMEASRATVTVGKRGCLCYDSGNDVQEAPALSTRVVDRFGAVDAVFSITSLCARLGAPLEIQAFLGNIAGAETVATVGNAHFLEAVPFQRHVESLLR